MDMDLGLVRAFVTTAEVLHFGRAAKQLHLTQQALSKRIRRLEEAMKVLLFVRSTRTVELTEAGRRFLPLARELLFTADKVESAVQRLDDPLRIDVLQEHLAPTALVRTALEADSALRIELSARRGLDRSVSAMLRDEIDMAFGRVYETGVRIDEELSYEVVRLEPLLALVPDDHPAANQPTLPLSQLSRWGVWTPTPGTSAEWSAFLRDLTQTFNSALSFENVAGTDIQQVLSLAHPRHGEVFLTGMDVANPMGEGIRLIPLSDPAPVFPWSVIWRRRDRHPQVQRFLSTLRRLRAERDWCVCDACWTPEADSASVRRATAVTAGQRISGV